jgi:3-oxoacyl-[acyl-carrier protein] reductase
MKRVFITGGSRGLGAACVELFSQRGWEVVFTYHTGAERAQTLCERLQGVSCLPLDLSDSLAVYETAKELGIETDTPEQLARYKESWK